MNKEIIIGIDLGTTNSVVSYIKDGLPIIIPVDGEKIMPSCVGLTHDGSVLVGKTARNQIIAAPDRTVLSIKRKMGTNETVTLGGKVFTPIEISALILNKLRKSAIEHLGQPINKAVIAVPAYFDEHQREATRKAGELAGLEVARIVNEPTAAAMAYGLNAKKDENILVYDLGGGTFDVSLVSSRDGITEVKASHGDTQLGGDDFDNLLIDTVSQDFKLKHGIELRENLVARTRLKIALEHAKCQLSDGPFASVKEEFITPQHHLDIELKRIDFEVLIEKYLDKTLDCVSKTLDDAKISPTQLDKVILVGGSTRIPEVHRLLQEKTGKVLRWEVDPDLIVAMGAAMLGGSIAGEELRTILVDITPHTFSTMAMVDDFWEPRLICVPIIKRNTPIPTRKSEVFFTSVDNQKKCNCKVYQGESTDPDENTLVHEFIVDNLSDKPAGSEIIVNFDLNLNGMLEVTAIEKCTGLRKSVIVDIRKTQQSVHQGDVVNIADYLGTPEIEFPQTDDPNSAKFSALVKKAHDLQQKALAFSHLAEDDKEELDSMLAEMNAMIADKDEDNLPECIASLEDFIFYVND